MGYPMGADEEIFFPEKERKTPIGKDVVLISNSWSTNSFKGFQTKAKNKHLEHLEDQIIDNGSKGGQNAVNFLVAIRNMLAGKSSRKVNMTVKWDGAPAIICGINPENGRFFVGTKSVFNKTPKINYTNERSSLL